MTTPASRLSPGPRPYGEDRAHLFFGREKMVDRMLDATYGELFVLSADSGSGKSSLLAAGYIPELRRQRARGIRVPPALLLRDWGGGRSVDAETRLLEGALAAVADLGAAEAYWREQAATPSARAGWAASAAAVAQSLPSDRLRLEEAVHHVRAKRADGAELHPAINGWRTLCDATSDGLLVILDQFEEFMGSASQERDPLLAEHAVAAVGRLCREEPRLKVVIALRAEYCRTLQRLLNRYVVNLDSRILDLAPLTTHSIHAVVTEAARCAGISYQDEPAKAFIGRVVDLGATQPPAAGEASATSRRTNSWDRPGISPLSLLGIHALLVGYESRLEGTGQPLRLDPVALDEYLSELRDRPGQGSEADPGKASAPRPADGGTPPGETTLALRRWVHDQLSAAADGDDGESRADERAARARLARWILEPLLPRLSAHGGYKQHLLELQLYRDLVTILVPAAPRGDKGSVHQALAAWMNGACDVPDFGTALGQKLELSGTGEVVIAARAASTGVSANAALVVECLMTLRAVLIRLTKAGVLKVTGQGEDRTCELVHDGLSDYVRSWAEALALTPDVACGSPVPIRGNLFRWATLGGQARGRVDGVRWIGTTLIGATIKNVDFVGCDLTGMFFRNCTFRDVTFTGCTLAAAVFDATDLSLGFVPAFEEVTFVGCGIQSTAFKSACFGTKVVFSGTLYHILEANRPLANDQLRKEKRLSDMTSVSFRDCKVLVDGGLTFLSCVLRFAQFDRFRTFVPAPTGDAAQPAPTVRPSLRFERCDLMNAWVWDGGFESVKIDHECRTIGLLSFDLPEPAWLNRDIEATPAGRD